MLTYGVREQSGHRAHKIQRQEDDQLLAQRTDPVADSVLAMHNTHGNQHVQRALAQRDPDKKQESIADKIIIGTTVFDGEAHAMYRLFGRRVTISADQLNGRARQLMDAATQLSDYDKKTDTQMALIESKTGKGGKAALEKMGKAEGALKKTVGPSAGFNNREIAKNYLDAIGAAEAQFDQLGLKRKDIDIAFSVVHQAAVKSKKLKAQRDVKDAEEAEAAEQKRVDDEKKYLGQMVDMMGKLADPTDWVGLLVDAGTFVAKEIIEKNYTTSMLEELKKKTEETKALLAGIEDEEILAEMKTASMRVDQAKQAYAAQKKVFSEAMKKVRREEADMTKLLEKSGATKGAAGALKERSEIAATAVAATETIQFVLAGVPKVLAAEKDLDKLYDRVLAELPNPNVSMAFNAEHGDTLKWLVYQNYHVIAQMKTWLEELTVVHTSYLETLQSGAYFEGYDRIPDVLDEAVAGKG
jgi:hypothetical protein